MAGAKRVACVAFMVVVFAGPPAAWAQFPFQFVEGFENITGPLGQSVDTSRFGPLVTVRGVVVEHGSIDRTLGTSVYSTPPDRNGDGFINSADDAAFSTAILSGGPVPAGEPPIGATFPGPLPVDFFFDGATPPFSVISSGQIRFGLDCSATQVTLTMVAPSAWLGVITVDAVQAAGGTLLTGPSGVTPIGGPFFGELIDRTGDLNSDGIGDSSGYAVVVGTNLIIATNDASQSGYLADVGVGGIGAPGFGRQLGRADLGLPPSNGIADPTNVPFDPSIFSITPFDQGDSTVDDLEVTFFHHDLVLGSTFVEFAAPTVFTAAGLPEETVSSVNVVPAGSPLITDVKIVSRTGIPNALDASWNGEGPDTYHFAVDDLLVTTVSLVCPGDTDQDGDVDLADFLVFLACFTGPGGGPLPPECRRADLDSDGDVDLADLVSFQAAYTGPTTIGTDGPVSPVIAAGATDLARDPGIRPVALPRP